ncbi:MAG: cyclophane-forming radical SAM/SPASM peptide maturase YhhB [Allosphingosinicella sp.]
MLSGKLPSTKIDTVLVKLASRCNLDCDYCYVYNMGDDAWRRQPKLMSLELIDALGRGLARLIVAQNAPLSVVFHGGEPLLMGPARFEAICAAIRAHVGPEIGLHVQTNGVLLTDGVIDVCERYDVGISISIDGPAQVHDRHRVTRTGRGSHAAVLAAIARLAAHRAGGTLFSGLLCVIDLAADPAEVYRFLKATGAPSIDFLYRDGNHDQLPVGKTHRDSAEYGTWMAQLLDVYLGDPAPIRVRVLDDMLRLLLGGHAVKEGIGENAFGILVVDTDGTVAKNDTLKSAASGDRFSGSWSVQDGLDALVASAEFAAYHRSQSPSAAACIACTDLAICGGGMPTHRWSAERGLDNPSVFCADQKLLIGQMRARIGCRDAA